MNIVLFVALIFTFNLYASTLKEAKKLYYAEQTQESISKYKNILEELVSQNNVEAILMMASTYETGSHWDKDMPMALKYYQKAATLGSAKALVKLGILEYNNGNYTNAKINFTNALKHGETRVIEYLLEIAKIDNNQEDIDRYLNLAKQNNVLIDELVLNEISTQKNKKSNFMKYIEDKTFSASKDYIVGILKIVSSLDGAFKNLGFEVDEYIIHNGLEPTVELILKKIPNASIDEDMAMLIAGDNLLKKSILNSLIWANALEPFIRSEVNHKLSRVELEVGTSATAKIVTTRIQND